MKSPWIEAMRLRTLPVSMAGVIAAVGYAALSPAPKQWVWAGVAMIFALLAQIASNFANEYFDYRAGIDSAGRQGPTRGVSTGLISPKAMLRAAWITLALACLVGLTTIVRGGWILLPIGVVIALGAMAYSTGPYPLSRHCLGEVAVILFFGVVPVCLTFYLLTLTLTWGVVIGSVGIGIMGAMVILCNNYRDIASDRATGKHTLSTRIGPLGSALLYCAMGQFAALLLAISAPYHWNFLPIFVALLGFYGGWLMWQRRMSAEQCTRLLAATAMALLLLSTAFALMALL